MLRRNERLAIIKVPDAALIHLKVLVPGEAPEGVQSWNFTTPTEAGSKSDSVRRILVDLCVFSSSSVSAVPCRGLSSAKRVDVQRRIGSMMDASWCEAHTQKT